METYGATDTDSERISEDLSMTLSSELSSQFDYVVRIADVSTNNKIM